ncbi:hypothetical protein PILCRDRAFT_10497 [Piloderma croceum F 1598]|uniref:Bacteriophage T5 Orf172 DNA-binding domain-containing protein n=1 Tax=Piloderma croceum (strain F 1598) TaxID=765440 RepID=A0A0C3F3L3_PILCF|nr:hypothetical protein PILCRDRAFT_10497 [Piloderma croceum F 1598]
MTSLQPGRDVDYLVNKLDTLSISCEHDRLPGRNRATSFHNPSGTPRPMDTLKSTSLVERRSVMVDDVFTILDLLGPPSYRLPSMEAWIPDYLDTGTKIALREAMKMAPSCKDTWGYVYACDLQGPNGPDPDKVRIKVGSSNNVVRRLREWRKQCYTTGHVLLGHWPAGLDDEGCHSEAAKLMYPGRKGPFCRRVERLVHLELADLVVHGQYHHPDFTSEKTDGNFTLPKQLRMPTRRGVFPRQECSDCHKVHREIFTLDGIKCGINKDSEWDLIVRPIIVRWGAFVEAHVEAHVELPLNMWDSIRENRFHLAEKDG